MEIECLENRVMVNHPSGLVIMSKGDKMYVPDEMAKSLIKSGKFKEVSENIK